MSIAGTVLLALVLDPFKFKLSLDSNSNSPSIQIGHSGLGAVEYNLGNWLKGGTRVEMKRKEEERGVGWGGGIELTDLACDADSFYLDTSNFISAQNLGHTAFTAHTQPCKNLALYPWSCSQLPPPPYVPLLPISIGAASSWVHQMRFQDRMRH